MRACGEVPLPSPFTGAPVSPFDKRTTSFGACFGIALSSTVVAILPLVADFDSRAGVSPAVSASFCR
jgi:hypothetical protein